MYRHNELLEELTDKLYEQVRSLKLEVSRHEADLSDSKSRIERLQDANAKITEDLQNEQRKNGELRDEIEKKDDLNKSLTKKEIEYNLIDFPSVPLKDIETQMKYIEPTTSRILVEYLKLDSYKLVQNLAQVTNSDTAANIIAYRDGALGRNEALIQRIQ